MSPDQDLRAVVLRTLGRIAPDADLATLAGTVDLRDALDLDSMDFLRFVVALHDELHVDVPEQDYARLRTLDACVAYLAARATRSG